MGSEYPFSDLPALVVFDLDACLWYPEMYMMRNGAPFKYDAKRGVAIARDGEEVTLMSGVRHVLKELHTDPKWSNTKVAVASSCDVPEWARELLKLIPIEVGEGKAVPMGKLFYQTEIRFGNKQQHFRNLHKATNVRFEDMLFFDDQHYNCREVGQLGVVCQLTPDGLTLKAWQAGLAAFAKTRQKR